MSDAMVLIEQLLLELGLEDLIPLPEAAESCRHDGLLGADEDERLAPLMTALSNLFRAGKIQVWEARAVDDEEELVAYSQVEGLLRDPANYEWGEISDAEPRIYFVNVENLYVDPGDQ